MAKIFLTLAAVFGGLSVASGAFGSHVLRSKITERSLEIFETAARYQMYHALALLVVVLLLSRLESPPTSLLVTGWSFVVGIFLFSGSLYALSLSGVKILGAVAPLGGAAFITGWVALAFAAWSLKF